VDNVSLTTATTGPTYRGTVYPWHCDHMGHVNAAWYVERFDEATLAFLSECGLPPSYFRGGHHGVAAVELNVVYRRELTAGDVVSCYTRLTDVKQRTLYIEHTLRHDEARAIAAVCQLTIVHLDRLSRKTAAFPPDVLTSLRHRLRGG
jgi:acyl-CoA thioester hydrolase